MARRDQQQQRRQPQKLTWRPATPGEIARCPLGRPERLALRLARALKMRTHVALLYTGTVHGIVYDEERKDWKLVPHWFSDSLTVLPLLNRLTVGPGPAGPEGVRVVGYSMELSNDVEPAYRADVWVLGGVQSIPEVESEGQGYGPTLAYAAAFALLRALEVAHGIPCDGEGDA